MESKDPSKANQIANPEDIKSMFESIAKSYDVLNTITSFGLDEVWRKSLIKECNLANGDKVLDVACGTGKLSNLLHNAGADIVGVDFSVNMINIAREKYPLITFLEGDATDLKFNNNHFNFITTAYGFRNFVNKTKALSEFYRVLSKDGGKCIILDFRMPKGLWRLVFGLYFKTVVPFLGRVLSKNSEAYTYLPKSVEGYISRDYMELIAKSVGFRKVTFKNLAMGVAELVILEV